MNIDVDVDVDVDVDIASLAAKHLGEKKFYTYTYIYSKRTHSIVREHIL